MKLELEFNDDRLRRLSQEYIERVGDLTPVHRAVGEFALGQIDDRFRTETDPNRQPWIPNSPVTIARKQAEGRILKVLQSTGFMRSRAYYSATKERCEVGINDRKAIKHQKGRGVPVRKILGFNQSDRDNIVGIYREYLELIND